MVAIVGWLVWSLTLVMLIKLMPYTFLTVSQSDYFIQNIDINSHTE